MNGSEKWSVASAWMRSRPSALVTSALLLVVAACGGRSAESVGQPDDDPLDARTKAKMIDEYLVDSTKALCASLVTCCQPTQPGAYEQCLGAMQPSRDVLFGDANLDHIYFDADAADRCLSAQTDAGCAAYQALLMPAADACGGLYAGKLKPGRPCSDASECAASRGFKACAKEAPSGAPVCRVSRPVKLGQACDTTCVGDRCVGFSFDPPVLGECHASDELYCSPSARVNGKPTCAPLPLRGASCPDGYCAPGNICQDGICVAGTSTLGAVDEALAFELVCQVSFP